MVFYSDQCAPCRAVKLFIQKRAAEYPENAKEKLPRVIRINVLRHDELAEKYVVFSIPCLVLIKNGNPVEYVASSDQGQIDQLFLKAEVIGFA